MQLRILGDGHLGRAVATAGARVRCPGREPQLDCEPIDLQTRNFGFGERTRVGRLDRERLVGQIGRAHV